MSDAQRPSSLDLDRRALGLLSEEEEQRVDAAVAADPALAQEAAADEEARRDFMTRVLPKTLERVEARVAAGAVPKRTASLFSWMPWLAAPLAAAAVLVLWLGRGDVGPRRVPGAGDGNILIKGGPSLEVVARRGTSLLPVTDGMQLAAGDAIRFVAQPGTYTHVLVMSVDGAGQVSVYAPFDGSESLTVSGRTELPGSVVLDESPGPERVYAFFSSAPLAVADVKAALAPVVAGGEATIRGTRTVAMPGVAQVSILIEKESP